MRDNTTSSLIKNLEDPKSLEIKDKIHQVADISTNLLIYGETGVGKDFWVNYLHHISRYKAILNLNCGDVPENLLESEWFGYKKGAFTGAEKDYDGKWRKAEGGILYLNQIDLLSLNLQSRLLRIIERKKYYPLGSGEERSLDARFVFSADADIEQKVRDGEFRSDLYYRISAYKILVPPLRERKKDILPLAKYFAGQRKLAFSISPDASKFLTNYPWRGNIREIDNFMTSSSVGKTELTDSEIYSLLKSSQDFFDAVKSLEMTLEELETRYIDFLLKKHKNKVTVAKLLGISRKSLYNKLNRQ